MTKEVIFNNKNFPLTIGLFGGGGLSEYESQIFKSISIFSEKNNINFLNFCGGEIKAYHDNVQQQNIIYKLINKNRINGLIFLGSCSSNYISYKEVLLFLKNIYPIPIVSIGAYFKGFPSVVIDNKKGMRDLVVHLIKDHKYKRIAFIRGPKTNPEAEERFAAYKEVLKEYYIPINNKLIAQSDFFMGSGSGVRELAIFLDERKISFDALVCSNDVIARNAINELKRRGIKVPEDISVTGFDNIEESNCIIPSLTTVNQPLDKLAEEAFNILLNLIKKDKIQDKIVLPTNLIIRRSCNCFFNTDLIGNNKIIKKNRSTLKNEKIKEIVINEIKKDKEIDFIRLKESFKNQEWLLSLLNPLINNKKDLLKKYLLTLEQLIIEGMKNGIEVLEWNSIISIILNNLKKYINYNNNLLNNLYNISYIFIGKMAEQVKSNNEMQYKNQEYDFFRISYNFNSCFDIEKFKNLIINFLPNIDIKSSYICLYEGKQKKYSRLLVGYDKIRNIIIKNKTKIFLSNNLLPDNIKLNYRRFSYIVLPLIYNNIQHGFVLFEVSDINITMYSKLQIQISNALRNIEYMDKIKKHSKELEEKVKERTINLEKAKEKIEDANLKLQKLDLLKNDFIANITHDFRSPLTVILNTTDIALRFDTIDDNTKENYSIINKASIRLKNSIDRLLELAKMDAQGIKLKIKKINIVSFMNLILDFYNSSVLNSGIKIIRKIPENEIDNFYSDTEKLEEIIDNIISNAIKFIDPNTGIITCELNDSSMSVIISISDNGIGIPKDKIKSIFNRFEQAYEGKNRVYRGTGIGLAFAKQLIEYLKGNIYAESEGEGKGSKFIIEFKKGKDIFSEKDFSNEKEKEIKFKEKKILLESEIEEKIEDQHIITDLTDLNKENEFNYKKAIILIIEDEKNIKEIIIKYLKSYGFKNFIIASEGKSGLDSVYEYNPDLIICDYNMPNMKGDDVHNQLLKNPQFKEIPFIFLSAVVDESLIIERREKGACAYLKKPIDEKSFKITIEEHIKKYFEYLKIIHLATVDELSGLNNRRSIILNLKHELAIRKYRDLSIIFFDIDHFKEINDTYGHQAGDQILQVIGQTIKISIRNYDIAGRYGGDEFIIILPDTNLVQAEYVAEVLRKTINKMEIQWHKIIIKTSSSFGISSLKDNADYIEKKLKIDKLENLYNISNLNNVDWDEIEKTKMDIADLLLKMADTALYKAKHTICKNCKFSSEKTYDFLDNKCPKCNSNDLLLGRNKITIFIPE